MKEETNETATANQPSEAQMNDMHKTAWLDFQTEAQEAKKEVSRRYAMMLETYGSYKETPYAAKQLVKQDYNSYKAKWGEQGEEQQKRFGVKEEQPLAEYLSLAEEKEAFLNKIQETREKTHKNELDYQL